MKYWPSSRGFNKLVIKAKMHANTYFFEIFFVIWKYNMMNFYFYFWETWPYAWIQKHVLLILLLFNVLTKTRYFNTRFISLQYKNTNRYWSKWKKGILQAQKVFEGFKNLGSTSTIYHFSLCCCLCRENNI